MHINDFTPPHVISCELSMSPQAYIYLGNEFYARPTGTGLDNGMEGRSELIRGG